MPPSRIFQSIGLTPAATIRRSTSPRAGFGRDRSIRARRSGPPNAEIATARMGGLRAPVYYRRARRCSVSGSAAAVTLVREGAIGWVRLERAHGNAINDHLVEGLLTALAEAESDPAIGGIGLAAAGKIFCPGLDLQEL